MLALISAVLLITAENDAKVTIEQPRISLGELCSLLSKADGAPRQAETAIKERKLTIFCKNEPIEEVCGQVAAHLGADWKYDPKSQITILQRSKQTADSEASSLRQHYKNSSQLLNEFYIACNWLAEQDEVTKRLVKKKVMSYGGPPLKHLSHKVIESTAEQDSAIQTTLLFAAQQNWVERFGDGLVHFHYPTETERQGMSRLFPSWKIYQSYFINFNTWNRMLFMSSFDKKGENSPYFGTLPSFLELEEKQHTPVLQEFESEFKKSFYNKAPVSSDGMRNTKRYVDNFFTLAEHGENIYRRFGASLIFDGNRAYVSREVYSDELNLREYMKTLSFDGAKPNFQPLDKISCAKTWLHVHYRNATVLNQEEIPERILEPAESKYRTTRKLEWKDYAAVAEKLTGVQSNFFNMKGMAPVSFPIRPLIDHQILLKLMGSLSSQNLEKGLNGRLYLSDLSPAQRENALNSIWKAIQLHQVHASLVNDIFDNKSDHKKLWVNFVIVPLEQVGSSNGVLIQVRFGIDETEGLLTAFRITYLQDNP